MGLMMRAILKSAAGMPPVLAVVLLSFTTGCSMESVSTLSPQTTATGAAIKGGVMGGQQPVYNSAIGLYAAGSSGYGQGATDLLASATIKTNANGGFTIPSGTYTCPLGNPQMYITSTGGDPTGNASNSTNNAAIVLVAALGPCNSLPSFVSINEVTTAAAAFALGQFFTGFGASSDLIGAPSSNQIGLTNAFATAHNLANVGTGVATGTTADGGTNYSLPSNDQLKLNTIANVLSDCVNQTTSSSSPCTNFFAAVTPTFAPRTTSTTATAPTDIFQAAVYMSLNPTSTNSTSSMTNMATLIAMQTPFMPFSPALSAAPTDWTLAILYSGTGVNYLSSAAVDANGDVWFSNDNTTGGVVELNGGTGTIGGTAGVTGGFIGFYSGGSYTPSGGSPTTATANGTRQVAIDQSGNAWFPGYIANYLFRAMSGSGVNGVFPLPSGPTLPYAIAVDPANNIFATTGSTQIVSVSGTAANGTIATTTNLESAAAASLTISPSSVGYAPANGNSSLSEFSTTGLTNVTSSPFSPTGLSSGYGSAIDGNNRVLIVNTNGTSIIAVSSTNTYSSFASNSCLSGPRFIAVDGNNNVWVSNTNSTTTTVNGTSGQPIYTVCEFNNAGTLISSGTGFGPHGITTGRGIAVDLSGNVWVTSYTTGTNTVTEIVGAAVPVVNPISVAAKNSTVGTRP